MSTITHPESRSNELESEQGRPQFFDEQTRRRLAEEDSFAWRSVTGVLIAIVTIGLLIAVFAVAMAT